VIFQGPKIRGHGQHLKTMENHMIWKTELTNLKGKLMPNHGLSYQV
jgi:hypothetical protein